jgi:hypothetical protein
MEGGGTEEIAQYMEKKIMSRLSTLARYKKVCGDPVVSNDIEGSLLSLFILTYSLNRIQMT